MCEGTPPAARCAQEARCGAHRHRARPCEVERLQARDGPDEVQVTEDGPRAAHVAQLDERSEAGHDLLQARHRQVQVALSALLDREDDPHRTPCHSATRCYSLVALFTRFLFLLYFYFYFYFYFVRILYSSNLLQSALAWIHKLVLFLACCVVRATHLHQLPPPGVLLDG